jgi:hypothetical protein
MAPAKLEHLSAYLRAHTRGVKYEVVSASAAPIGPLIVRDGRPVLILTTINGRSVMPRARLAAAVRKGEARYAMIPRGHCTAKLAGRARCDPAIQWARAHSTDVSKQAHLPSGTLWHLTTKRSAGR